MHEGATTMKMAPWHEVTAQDQGNFCTNTQKRPWSWWWWWLLHCFLLYVIIIMISLSLLLLVLLSLWWCEVPIQRKSQESKQVLEFDLRSGCNLTFGWLVGILGGFQTFQTIIVISIVIFCHYYHCWWSSSSLSITIINNKPPKQNKNKWW